MRVPERDLFVPCPRPRPWVWLVALMYVSSLGCSGLEADPSPDDRDELAPSPPPAGELRVHRGIFQERVLLTGTLEAVRAVQINTPRTPTWQVQIYWMEEDGAKVVAGQKIVELDSSAFTANLEEQHLAARKEEKELQRERARAEAESADKAFVVEQRRVDLEKARLQADIPEDLLPRRELQERKLALERARTALAKAEEDFAAHRRTAEQALEIRRITLEKIRYEIRLAEKAIEDLTLEAPTDGVVIVGDVRWEGRKLQEGDTVWPGFVLMRIPDLEEMRVVARLSDVDDGRVRAGMKARVWLDSYPELDFPAEVVDMTPVAQAMSPRSLRRAFEVRINLGETDSEKMRPGMAARVEVTARRLEDVLVAPRAAIDFETPTPRARLEDGTWAPVSLGPCNSWECVVETGLDEGAALGPVDSDWGVGSDGPGGEAGGA